jgi:hypothetical protein
VTSVDHNLEWLSKFLMFNKTKTHSIYHVTGTELETFGSERKWGMVLVDHGVANSRLKVAINFANKSTIVLTHDAEIIQDYYSYHTVKDGKKLVDYFKYVCKFSMFDRPLNPTGHSSTLIMSNFVDITFLEEIFKQINYPTRVIACDYKNY